MQRLTLFLAALMYLLSNAVAQAGCCSYGCCDCGCVAVHEQRADILERVQEIHKGYDSSQKEVVVSFPVLKSGNQKRELSRLNSSAKNLGVTCGLVRNTKTNQSLISCPILLE